MKYRWFHSNGSMKKATAPLNIFTSKIINSDEKILLIDIFNVFLKQRKYFKPNTMINHWLGINANSISNYMSDLAHKDIIKFRTGKTRDGSHNYREVYALNVHMIFGHRVHFYGKYYNFIGPDYFPKWLKKVEKLEANNSNSNKGYQYNNSNNKNKTVYKSATGYQPNSVSSQVNSGNVVNNLFSYNSKKSINNKSTRTSANNNVNYQSGYIDNSPQPHYQNNNQIKFNSYNSKPVFKRTASTNFKSNGQQNNYNSYNRQYQNYNQNTQTTASQYNHYSYQSNNHRKQTWPRQNGYKLQESIDNPYVNKLVTKLHRSFPILNINSPKVRNYIYHWLTICSYKGVKRAIKWSHQHDKKDHVYKPLAYTNAIVNETVKDLKSRNKDPKKDQSFFGTLSQLKDKVFYALYRNASND